MRVFYALTLPPRVQQYCSLLINSLQKNPQFKQVRWTPPEYLHITLRFHSQIDAEQLDKINTLLHEQLPNYAPPNIATRRYLLLPTRKPHLLALGVHLSEALAGLVRTINQAHSTVGIDLEKRPFLPHITLGRFNESTPHENIILNSVKGVEESTHEMVLYKSEPTDTGSVYTILDSFQLKS